jgi:DNA-binding transcriptional LysR family regulator
MFSESFDLVVAGDHELARINDLELQVEVLRKERLLLHTLNDGSELALAALEQAGIRTGDAHVVSCNRDLEALVQAGFGVAVLPHSTFQTDRLRHLALPGLELRRTVAVYSIAGRPRSREAMALLGLVRSADWEGQLAA